MSRLILRALASLLLHPLYPTTHNSHKAPPTHPSTNELNARLQAYKWEQDTPRSPCTPRTPASPMPPSAARSRHSAPPERGLASPFRTRGHSRHPTSPPSPTTDVSYLRGGGDTLGPYDSISAYHPPRRGGTNQDGDSDTERPRSRQSRHTRRPSRSATPVPQSYTSRAAMTPTKPRSRSRSRSRSSSPTPSGHEKFEHPGRSTDPTDEAEYEAEYEPHGLQFRSMKAHRAALLAAQHRRAERVVDAQDARDADQAAAVAEQLRNSLQLAQSNDRLQAAEAAVRDLQARLVVEKLRTGQVERRAAEAEAKRAADKAELAVAVSILRRVKDDKRRTEEERRRALRAFEEAKSR
ncbi:hypothetical protein CC85DRAFT_17589 [Cutaneotrichosporon oleaginosum]|uniref:Uncharacterized protein n=1 Tax=Cutaneotrichosporon oleaginosum TaxID=879819 RepID=A0A0J0XTK6_9TREE|nr:uncharacterized protein CC85DRAFT_17589 [Cutaneotrichosporon oleaginosum]KLT44410.1 hypothetical protein CC85DRAFT_17589 [Cutaneotrichosporon oleaginosum]TXT07869.1 hypothetical protein COLE_04793 [Cutaneotrichosporon oleaginosum]